MDWLSLLPQMLDNVFICLCIICFPVYDVKKFEINLSFPMKTFFYIKKKQDKKIKILKAKRATNKVKYKNFDRFSRALIVSELIVRR